ncbi:arsenate reductase [Litorimonas taeanensis]|uniref:Arsenate reductase n=1 Tax=Litorimonas taeanensis TaxID=568099 RepID=A0A420WFP1_9PROT|nr:arsenate reductase (glutaredoxin) [Litorimonas taeanensis]RKQ69779.1 arsenate reductase [Litorimonas taeanensis]
MTLTIYHNPRCSKSRQTLAIIEAAGQSPEIVRYLENPLSTEEIKTLLSKLGLTDPRDIMRKGEAIYKELGLKCETDAQALIEAIASHPKLLERPIVVKGSEAIMGRPPENVNKLLP